MNSTFAATVRSMGAAARASMADAEHEVVPARSPSVLHLLATDRRRGAESFGLQLHSHLAGRGWASSLAVVRGEQGPVDAPVLGRGWWHPVGLRRYVRRARSVDVVVAHGSTTLWSAALGSLVSRTPFVYVNIGDPLFWTARLHRRVRVAALLRRAAAVAAISSGAAEALRGHLRVPADRVVVLGNARSTTRFTPATAEERSTARTALGLRADTPLVVFIGSLSDEKRPELAVSAVAALPDAHLIVVGDGPLMPRVRELAESAMPDRVQLLGVLDDPAEVLAAADCLILTSRSEGVPGVLIEAGLAGLPAVATRVGYSHEVVLDGRTGRVVDDGDYDAVAQALTAAVAEALQAGSRWGRAARDHCVARYSLDDVVAQWDELLRGIVTARGETR